MGYQIGNLGPGRQRGDHKAKAIEKYSETVSRDWLRYWLEPFFSLAFGVGPNPLGPRNPALPHQDLSEARKW